MAESVKLTEEEIGEVENVGKRSQALRNELGDIAIIKLNLKTREEQAAAFHNESIQLERDLAKKLEDKYGKGTIDISTGTFTPIEE